MRKNLLRSGMLLALMSIVSLGSYAQTFIHATLPNPNQEPAIGYRFQIVTPGDVLDAVAQTEKPLVNGDARVTNASLSSTDTSLLIRPVRDSKSMVSFNFNKPLPVSKTMDVRVAFTPKEYWKVYFQDFFQYADGHSERSRIPYAAFFISYEPTKDPSKLKATLTVVNHVGTMYGIPSSVINDESRKPIVFKKAVVYINNTMKQYDLAHFDQPDGQRVELPGNFTLKAGEAQTFDLGVVNADSYVLTVAEMNYLGEKDVYPIACSHPTNQADASAANTKYTIFGAKNKKEDGQ